MLNTDFYCPLCGTPVEQTGASVMDELRKLAHESDHRDDIHAGADELLSRSVPCWRCGDQPENHLIGEGCEGYIAGDPAFTATRPKVIEGGGDQ